LRATADLKFPQRGLALLHLGDAPLAGWLLGVTAGGDLANPQGESWTPADAYVRGDDLVVAYGAAPELPFGMQIYWRVSELASLGAVVLDAIVSIQTRAWEAFPELVIASALSVESAQIDDNAFVLRHMGLARSYIEMPHPDDHAQHSFGMGGDNMARTRWNFGREFIERGVIRRFRIRGAFVSRDGDMSKIAELRQSLIAEAPPLTA
jgi:hypothetical protein